MTMSRLAEDFRPTRILGLNPRWKGLNDCSPHPRLLPTLEHDKQAYTQGSKEMIPPPRDLNRVSSVSQAAFIYTPHLPSTFTLSVHHPHSVTSICWSLAVFCHCGIKAKVKSLSGLRSRHSCNNSDSQGALFSNQWPSSDICSYVCRAKSAAGKHMQICDTRCSASQASVTATGSCIGWGVAMWVLWAEHKRVALLFC